MTAITPGNCWPWQYCKSRIQTSLHYFITSHNKHDISEAFPDVRRRNQLKRAGWRLQKHRRGEFRDKIPSGNARHSGTDVLLDSLSINPLPSIHFQHLAVTHKSTVARKTVAISNGMFSPGLTVGNQTLLFPPKTEKYVSGFPVSSLTAHKCPAHLPPNILNYYCLTWNYAGEI